jgi:hypothetical protein
VPYPVGTKAPKPFGLYDMLGNVAEWVKDWYDTDYYRYCVVHNIVADPPGPATGSEKSYRGGNCSSRGESGLMVYGIGSIRLPIKAAYDAAGRGVGTFGRLEVSDRSGNRG